MLSGNDNYFLGRYYFPFMVLVLRRSVALHIFLVMRAKISVIGINESIFRASAARGLGHIRCLIG